MTMKMIVLAIVFMACASQWVAGAGPENQLTQVPVCAGVDKATCEEKNGVEGNEEASLLQVNIGAHSQANETDDEECDWECYLDRYPGLAKVCSMGKHMNACARKHWKTHGSKEGRDCTCSQAPTEFDQFVDTCPFLNTDTGENGAVSGMFPQGDGPFPLAVYLQGTRMPYGHQMAVDMLEQMAQRGFAAVNIHYSNMKYGGGDCQVWEGKASNVASCVDQMCEHEKVDCSLGLALFGYSQGGQVSSLVGNYTTHTVTAQFGMSSSIMSHGYTKSGMTWAESQAECLKLKVPRNKRRILIGDKDGHFGGNGKSGSGEAEDVIAMSQLALGLLPSDCPDEMHCIQDDGSGYYVATQSETGAMMNHFWFIAFDMKKPFGVGGLSKAFTSPPNADDPWGAKASFDWLASAARV